ncbi:MAG: hypothetical protein HW383_604 [Candidatus Magasanikbacteria bacterium]|nr:hypothetical protein [Candidatus Magasanikbacteria bacterium]
MSNRTIKNSLKEISNIRGINPAANFVARNREILMMQVKNTLAARVKDSVEQPTLAQKLRLAWKKIGMVKAGELVRAFLPQQSFRLALRPIMIIALVFVVATGGWITTVSASLNSLPGDVLYSVKIATEKTQLALTSMTGGAAAETALRVSFVARRVDEVSKIVETASVSGKNSKEKQAQVTNTARRIKEDLKQVNASIEEMKKSDPTKVMEVAKMVDRKTSEFHTAIKKSDGQLDSQIKSDLTQIKDAVTDSGVKAVQTIVEKHLEGDKSLTQNEVKDKVDDKIKMLAADVADSVQDVVQIVNVTSATSTVTATGKVVNLILPTQTATDAVKTSLEQARVALQKNDFSGAMDKVKEGATATQEVEKIVDQAVKAVVATSTLLKSIDTLVPLIVSSSTTSNVIIIKATSTEL